MVDFFIFLLLLAFGILIILGFGIITYEIYRSYKEG